MLITELFSVMDDTGYSTQDYHSPNLKRRRFTDGVPEAGFSLHAKSVFVLTCQYMRECEK
jgi:hypothetical protein